MLTPKKLILVVRPIVMAFSVVWAVAVLVYILATIPPSPSRAIAISKTFADTAGVYLYLTLLIGPLSYLNRKNIWSAVALRARRAVGISVLLFALLHSLSAFFFQLGGIAGLQFLSSRYLLAMALGADALILLLILAATSFDSVVTRMGARMWKHLHRFVYVAALCVLAHVLLIGSRFANFHDPVVFLVFLALIFLWMLECNRIDAWMARQLPQIAQYHLGAWTGLGVVLVIAGYMFFNPHNPFSLSDHDGHYQFENRVGLDGEHGHK